MGAFFQWLDNWAQLLATITVPAFLAYWLKKTNSAEHSHTTSAIHEMSGELGELRGTVETYIDQHAKVHERLPY